MSRRPGYRCELTVLSTETEQVWRLGEHVAETPERALDWLLGQARRLADALDPQPGAGPLPAACLRLAGAAAPGPGEVFRDWLHDRAFHDVQLRALHAGHRISANALTPDLIAPGTPTTTLYTLTCVPAATAGRETGLTSCRLELLGSGAQMAT